MSPFQGNSIDAVSLVTCGFNANSVSLSARQWKIHTTMKLNPYYLQQRLCLLFGNTAPGQVEITENLLVMFDGRVWKWDNFKIGDLFQIQEVTPLISSIGHFLHHNYAQESNPLSHLRQRYPDFTWHHISLNRGPSREMDKMLRDMDDGYQYTWSSGDDITYCVRQQGPSTQRIKHCFSSGDFPRDNEWFEKIRNEHEKKGVMVLREHMPFEPKFF